MNAMTDTKSSLPDTGHAELKVSSVRKTVLQILERGDIRIGGSRPWDIQIHDERLFERVMSKGTVGLGEGYMEGWWDCGAVDEFFERILYARKGFRPKPNLELILFAVKAKLQNRQTKVLSMGEGRKHYDIGNDLYRAMLDKRMVYTCAFWKGARNLDEAQEAKLDLTCRKLGLRPGMRILDIGCGWGSFAKFAAERYGVQVVGITVSQSQVDLGIELCRGLPVEIRLQDYRNVNEQFDHIVSLGMFEHVGHKNFREYMLVAHRCLRDQGMFLLHTCGENRSETEIDAWIDKYIFPNANIPSIAQIGAAIENIFVMEDWHNLSTDYERTLMAWNENFESHWSELSQQYGETFHRMWRYYLLQCAGGFRARKNQLWQIVLAKNPKTQYQPLRY